MFYNIKDNQQTDAKARMIAKRYPAKIYHITFICLLYFLVYGALAADINGIAGYRLGETFDKKTALAEQKSDDNAIIYTVKPLVADSRISILTIRLTKQHQIHRISAFSPVMTPAECQTRMDQLRMQTEKQFPMMGYYAMDQSELFYQDDRTYTLDCIKTDDGIRLRQEFSDDKLANLAE
jgi:hypothetical protein